jgi:uncharacterized delta-60 repeat protein
MKTSKTLKINFMKKEIKTLCIGLICQLSFVTTSNAQDGTLDVSFGNNGIVQTVSAGAAYDMVIQPDNKIIVVGDISFNFGYNDMAVVRYNPDGSLDNSFGTNGIVSLDFNGGTDDARAVKLQNDGKIIVVGRAQQNSSNNNSDIAVVRLNSDGTLDNSFATNGKFTLDVDGYAYDNALDVAIQADGKIVLVAMAGTNSFNKNAVIRLNANGTLDNTFDGDGILKAFSFGAYTLSSLYSLAIQTDGKILIGGSKSYYLSVARINSDGSLDATYGTNGIYSTSSEQASTCKLKLQPDGKLLATYSYISNTSVNITRLNSDGTPDLSFGSSGLVATSIGSSYTKDNARDITIQPNGKILATGSSYSSGSVSDFLVVRYNSDGTLDNTFGTNGIVITSVDPTDWEGGNAIKLQSDGKIVVAGSSCSGACDFVLLRYNNSDGSVGIFDNDNVYNNFIVYPNPNKGTFTLKASKAGVFDLIDVTGKVINTYTITNSQQTVQDKIPAGMYFVREKASGKAQKIIIQ